MSMRVSWYCGPYLKVTGVALEFIEKHENLVQEGRGEFRHQDGGVLYLVPNRAVPGIARELDLGDSPQTPLDTMAEDRDCIVEELMAFMVFAQPVISATVDAGGNGETCWGLVQKCS